MEQNYFKKIAILTFTIFSVLFVNAQNAPTFTSVPVTSVNNNVTYTYYISTDDLDGDAVSITGTTVPAWLTLTQSTVSTLAGQTTAGYTDNAGALAQFSAPFGAAIDASGNVYIGDEGNNVIRRIAPDGTVITLAGNGTAGFVDNADPTLAQFDSPDGLAVDAAGNVYVADYNNNRIRKIDGTTGAVTTLAGAGGSGYLDNANPLTAQFANPTDVAVDAAGNVYVADFGNSRIRKIDGTTGEVTTVAGDGTLGFQDNVDPLLAKFNGIFGITVDASGNLYVADTYNNRIRKIDGTTGEVTTFAGDGTQGSVNGSGATAQFNSPIGITIDASGNLFVSDYDGAQIRKINSSAVVSTVAGVGTSDYLDGAPAAAKFYQPSGIAVDANGFVYVAEYFNNTIRKIAPAILTGDATGQPAGSQNIVLTADDSKDPTTDQIFSITVNDVTPPTVTTLVPADNATAVTSNNLQITFDEDVQKGTGNISVYKTSDNSLVGTVDVTNSAVTISGATVSIPLSSFFVLPSNTEVYVQIPNTAFTDLASNAYAGIADTTSWSFTTDIVLGIQDNFILGFAMYPNPVSNVVNIHASDAIQQVKVYNLLGQEMLEKTVGEKDATVNLSNLSSGNYIIKVSTENAVKAIHIIKK